MRRSALLFDPSNCPTPAFSIFLKDISVPGDDLISIDEALQKRFFQKGPNGQPLERWELKEVETKCPQELIMNHLKNCGFVEETLPDDDQFDYAAWPGALAPRAAVRFCDLLNGWLVPVLWKETIAFGGKRPLQPEKESFAKCCDALNIPHEDKYASLWSQLNPQTELDIMKFLWAAAIVQNDYSIPPVLFIDAPMKPPIKEGGLPVRPNTEDTIHEWLRSNPAPGSILLSSGAPYGMAQDETFWKLLGPLGFTVETFGHAAPDLPIETFMREVAGCVHQIRAARLGL